MKEEALKKASQTQENLVAQLTTEKSKTQQQTQFIKRLQRKLLLISKVCHCIISLGFGLNEPEVQEALLKF